jgi:hypothetical protein
LPLGDLPLQFAHLSRKLAFDPLAVLRQIVHFRRRRRGRRSLFSILLHQVIDDVQEGHRIDRSADVPIRTEAQREALVLVVGIRGGNEDEWDIAEIRRLLALATEAIAVHARHQDIRYDQVDGALPQAFERIEPVGGANDLVAPRLKQDLQEVAVLSVVVGNEYFHCPSSGSLCATASLI